MTYPSRERGIFHCWMTNTDRVSHKEQGENINCLQRGNCNPLRRSSQIRRKFYRKLLHWKGARDCTKENDFCERVVWKWAAEHPNSVSGWHCTYVIPQWTEKNSISWFSRTWAGNAGRGTQASYQKIVGHPYSETFRQLANSWYVFKAVISLQLDKNLIAPFMCE